MGFDSLRLKKAKTILKKVNKLAPKMREMSDEELKKQTIIFKKQLASGKSLDDILPEAFAVVREADYRVLGLFPYDVQVLGAIVLHQGEIAEMKTGEGKTLVATMPLYLNALTEKGAILLTPNEYLASRDEEQLRPVYEWLGLSVSLGFTKNGSKKITTEMKKAWYNSDILYTTPSTLAFDYLFNNLATKMENQYLRPFNYVIIDEIDEVLLDDAKTPFVVSSKPRVQSNLYGLADQFVTLLDKDTDYVFKKDDQLYWLTAKGIKKAETFFEVENLFSEEARAVYRHIILALGAHLTMRKGHEYLVVQDKVVLLDENSGRLKHGIQVSTGLHQAVEAKEGVSLTNIQKTAASVTFPTLFRLFNKISGMSGTVKVKEQEFMDVYNLRVTRIPTRLPVQRKDYPPLLFLTTRDKLMYALDEVVELHKTGRPILLVAGSVENSEIISELLLNIGIPHNVLNAYNAAYEAKIIKDAGKKGAVTIATNMAGRGTDIKINDEVKKLGGLAVIGTEMLPKRVELQLAGRAGRQGDPGSSIFLISLEDSFISANSTELQKKNYRKLLNKKKKDNQLSLIKNPITLFSLKQLRERVEANDQLSRLETSKDSEIIGLQSLNYYKMRNTILKSDDLKEKVYDIIKEALSQYIKKENLTSPDNLKFFVNQHISYEQLEVSDSLKTKKDVEDFLNTLVKDLLHKKEKLLGAKNQVNEFYRQVIITAMNECWIDEIDKVDRLKNEAREWTNSSIPKDLLQRQKAYELYLEFLDNINLMAFDNLLLSQISVNEKGQLLVVFN